MNRKEISSFSFLPPRYDKEQQACQAVTAVKNKKFSIIIFLNVCFWASKSRGRVVRNSLRNSENDRISHRKWHRNLFSSLFDKKFLRFPILANEEHYGR